MLEATLEQVCDAGQVRLADLGADLLRREAAGLPTDAAEHAITHLRLGLEVAAQLAPGADQDAVLGYLIETYGLLAALTDPLLRPLLPPVPATGARVVPGVLAIGGKPLVVNGHLLILRSRLVATTPTP